MELTPAGFRHEIISSGDAAIHAVIGGAGPGILLIHGFPQTWYAWRHAMAHFAKTHTVVAIDLRGAGHSSSPQGGYDKVTMAADGHAVMSALGFRHYAVCGHDIGAMVALALAATQRDAVTRLVVLDTPQPGWSKWEAGFGDPRTWHFNFHMKRDLPERLIYRREYDYVSTFIFDRAFNVGAFSEDDIQVYARAFAQPGNTRGGLEWYRAFPSDHQNALAWRNRPLELPILALGGEHRFGPVIVEMMNEFASDVSGGTIAACGHWLIEENPAATVEAIQNFVGVSESN